MSVSMFNKTHESNYYILDLINSWWKKHSGLETLESPTVLFSEYGFLAFVENKPVLASFFYPLLGSDLCLWGYQVANPDSSFDERTIAIEETATAMSDFAKKLGYKIMIAYPGNKAIVKRLESVGFFLGDHTATQAFKRL
jgi:hypothetical protein